MPEVKILMFYRQRGGDGKLFISTTAPIVVFRIISARRPAILTEVFCGFPQSLQASA
jgi:hypothetical protein